MQYETWHPMFEMIKKDISLTWDHDKEAALVLNKLLYEKPNMVAFSYIKHLIFGKDVVVFGAGPSLEKVIKKIRLHQKKYVLLSADGATSALIEQNILPDIIVSDLDGKLSDQIYANKNGSIMIVHAHGDNLNTVKQVLPQINGKISGSVQIDPQGLSNVFNVGGFTDGDRAVYLAAHCHAKSISLAGFDFNGEIGRYSFPGRKDTELKEKKLYWCSQLINHLKKDHDIRFLKE